IPEDCALPSAANKNAKTKYANAKRLRLFNMVSSVPGRKGLMYRCGSMPLWMSGNAKAPSMGERFAMEIAWTSSFGELRRLEERGRRDGPKRPQKGPHESAATDTRKQILAQQSSLHLQAPNPARAKTGRRGRLCRLARLCVRGETLRQPRSRGAPSQRAAP